MPKQTKALAPINKEIFGALAKGLQLSVEQEQVLKANLPAWIPDKENLGTAMTQTGQEFLILLEDVLVRDFDFSEKDLVKLEKKVKKILPVLADTEITRDLSILSPKDMSKIGDIAEKRYERLDNIDKQFLLKSRNKLLR